LYSLEDLGWTAYFQSQLNNPAAGLLPARVAEEQRGVYLLQSERGTLNATVTGRLIHTASGREDFPAVGDWVLAGLLPGGQAVIRQLLERRSKISRKVAGKQTEEQIIAANVDTAFLVTSLNQELNVRRIERYLAVIWESGATPVIVLNKTDLSGSADEAAEEVRSLAPGTDVLATSAALGTGVDGMSKRIGPGQTAVFIGSSGVGKSSLVNRLMDGQVQGVREIRSDDKGRHTTTSRQMMVLPSGGLVIDTPGLRELQLWDADAGIGLAFQDIEALAAQCNFTDCSHAEEPGCAIQQAVDDGDLALDRLESYRKLEREQRFVESKKDPGLRSAERKKWKQIHKANRQRMNFLGK
jgi:ribosome biogenesis GTPase